MRQVRDKSLILPSSSLSIFQVKIVKKARLENGETSTPKGATKKKEKAKETTELKRKKVLKARN